jgi:hypothetical protein
MSGRGLCDELVPRPEKSYRLWCVSNICDHETSTKRGGPGPYRAVEPYTHTHTHTHKEVVVSVPLSVRKFNLRSYCADFHII